MNINKTFIKENWIILLLALVSILYTLYTGPYSLIAFFIKTFMTFLMLVVIIILLLLWKFLLPLVLVFVFDKFLSDNPFITAVFVYLCVAMVLYWLSKKNAADTAIRLGKYNILERSQALRDVLKNALIISIVILVSVKGLVFLLSALGEGGHTSLDCSVRGCRYY